MSKVFAINVSTFAFIMWGVVKMFLDPASRSKISLSCDKNEAEIKKYVHPSQLLKAFGGECESTNVYWPPIFPPGPFRENFTEKHQTVEAFKEELKTSPQLMPSPELAAFARKEGVLRGKKGPFKHKEFIFADGRERRNSFNEIITDNDTNSTIEDPNKPKKDSVILPQAPALAPPIIEKSPLIPDRVITISETKPEVKVDQQAQSLIPTISEKKHDDGVEPTAEAAGETKKTENPAKEVKVEKIADLTPPKEAKVDDVTAIKEAKVYGATAIKEAKVENVVPVQSEAKVEAKADNGNNDKAVKAVPDNKEKANPAPIAPVPNVNAKAVSSAEKSPETSVGKNPAAANANFSNTSSKPNAPPKVNSNKACCECAVL